MSDQDSLSTGSPSATNPDVDTSDPLSSSNVPITPMNDHLNAQAPGELSPPRSGDAEAYRGTIPQQQPNDEEDMMDQDSTTAWQAQHPNGGQVVSGAGPAEVGATTEYVPGSGWNNKKAQDEYHRAMENIVDQDFSLQEFGDPLLDLPEDQNQGNGNSTKQS